MKRVLAFFGAFNPPTTGHLEASEYAFRQTGREGVLFVPSKSDYIRYSQRKDAALSDETRLEMLEALSKTRPWMSYTDIEIKSEIQPRTYETLVRLKSLGYAPSLLVGSDKLTELESKWVNVDKIISEFGIVCLSRGDDECEKILSESPFLSSFKSGIELVKTPDSLHHISSTRVRQALTDINSLPEDTARMIPPEILPLLLESAITKEK